MMLLAACGAPTVAPNVMGMEHTAAREMLEELGFTVTEVEADAEKLLPGTAWDRSVKQGEVFKVNDSACPDYTEDYEQPTVEEGKIRIYYASEEYVCGE